MLALIPLLPLLGFTINAFAGRKLPKSVSGGIACLAMLGSFAVSAAAVWSLVSQAEVHPIEQILYTWIPSGELQVQFAFRLDQLSSLMILVVTGIGSLIHIYSTGYMHDEPDSEYARYFSYLNLFAAFMLVLVLGANLPVMFVGWEGVGLCSYLLIGFWFKKPSAADAGKKAFVVNRIGDFGFIIGMLLIYVTWGTFDFLELAREVSAMPVETGVGVITAATLLLFLGATGKSAQIPLYVWLPDAMEGPTPVSALIHAATMVTAGVYMIGRNAELFSHAPTTLAVVAGIGAATALMAGTIGLVQNDIKRVLAYSTVSQLGLMFLAMGVGAFAAGIFHLYTHAFFKALLFLGSGAVIHALAGEQDIRNMGGLKKYLPITYWTFLIGALAIAGVPLLSGFFSKDEILYRTFTGTEANHYHGYPVLWLLGAITSLLTAIYMFRLVFLTFHGNRRHAAAPGAHPEEEEPAARRSHAAPAQAAHGHAAHGHDPHDAPPSMAIPLIVLAIGSIVAGYIGIPHALGGNNWIEQFLHPSFAVEGGAHTSAASSVPAIGEDPRPRLLRTSAQAAAQPEAAQEVHAADAGLELLLMGVSSGIAVAGIGVAFFFWRRRPDVPANMARRMGGVYRLLLNKYYVDEIYNTAVVQPLKQISTTALWRGMDAGFIDGVVNGVGTVVNGGSVRLRRLQTGSLRTYAAALFFGAVAIVGWYLWMVR
jgi:NADH-quinone oxidoreductase subunit L